MIQQSAPRATLNHVHIPPPTIPTTWRAIIAAEPRIAQVVDSARPRGRRRNRLLAYESAKRQLDRLVGWHARHPGLRTSDHWDVVISRLIQAARV